MDKLVKNLFFNFRIEEFEEYLLISKNLKNPKELDEYLTILSFSFENHAYCWDPHLRRTSMLPYEYIHIEKVLSELGYPLSKPVIKLFYKPSTYYNKKAFLILDKYINDVSDKPQRKD